MSLPIDIFNFYIYNYEVAFEFQHPSFLRRLLTQKSDYLVYYIRRVRKMSVKIEEEQVLSFRRDYSGNLRYDFHCRNSRDWRPLYWDNSTEPQDILMGVPMKLRPPQDNVTFSTASLSSNLP